MRGSESLLSSQSAAFHFNMTHQIDKISDVTLHDKQHFPQAPSSSSSPSQPRLPSRSNRLDNINTSSINQSSNPSNQPTIKRSTPNTKHQHVLVSRPLRPLDLLRPLRCLRLCLRSHLFLRQTERHELQLRESSDREQSRRSQMFVQ